jgi:hypothetical protein
LEFPPGLTGLSFQRSITNLHGLNYDKKFMTIYSGVKGKIRLVGKNAFWKSLTGIKPPSPPRKATGMMFPV